LSTHPPSDYRDHDWNIRDDFHPLNITDNDPIDEHRSHDDDADDEDAYVIAYNQLLEAQQQNHPSEQDNMLSTILEASCEEATPMTSMVDIHQQRSYMIANGKSMQKDESSDDDTETEELIVPSSIDDIPVSTVFSKNESKNRSQLLTLSTYCCMII
jgi:hypothetical protein